MSRKALPVPPILDETARVARAAFPGGTLCLQRRDALGTLYTDADCADRFPTRGQPAEVPWRLALLTMLQVLEGRSDRQAADAVRSRLDWKDALSLELSDPGFDHTVLTAFRARLVQGDAAQRLLDVLLEQCTARGWLKARGRQRTAAMQVLATVRALNQLECVGETLRHALTVLAEVAPDWLQSSLAQAHPEWVERSRRRIEAYRLPTGTAARQGYTEVVGAAGWDLLGAPKEPPAPTWLRELPAVQSLQRVWAQQYQPREAGGHWRQAEELPPAGQVQNAPDDPDARYGKKRETTWVGYQVHLTETCDPDRPHLLTQVTTTPAATTDETMAASDPARRGAARAACWAAARAAPAPSTPKGWPPAARSSALTSSGPRVATLAGGPASGTWSSLTAASLALTGPPST